jgi:hypothetical protein
MSGGLIDSSAGRRDAVYYMPDLRGECEEMIDRRVRINPASVKLFQYQNVLRQFLEDTRATGFVIAGSAESDHTRHAV